MKLFTFCLLLLPVAALVETSPLKAESPNVSNFLKEALATTTEKTIPEKITEGRNSSGRPVRHQDSEESIESDQSGGESKDLDSHETLAHKDVANEQTPSRRTSRRSQNNVQLVEMTRRLAPDQESQQQIQGELQASGDQTDQNSTLGMTRKANREGFQRWAGRADGLYHGSVPDRSREAPDWDSLEENEDGMPPGYNSKPRDYDESRESTSSETFPFNPSGVSDPAKNRAA